ncbi:hypothetical protein HDU98_007934 [Podochytrium sp. JEL0797]|nr:hypothetical protein HDU98_007934 [Podochytrium sp. JEL0797]
MTISAPSSASASLPVERKDLQVVFVVDVTGSMGSQIEGVKQMMRSFCATERPGVQVHVWTFTENSTDCFVCKSPANLTQPELLEYVSKLKLSYPVDFPGVSAGGGDGPENVVAAVAELSLVFDHTDNVLAFIITDAPPHHRAFGNGTEMRNEKRWLEAKGFEDTDVFRILNQVVEQVNVTFVPILYSVTQALWYQQAALLTGGLCLVPSGGVSEVLAAGLTHILNTMQQLATTRQVSASLAEETAQNLRGFNILPVDADNFTLLDEDVATARDLTPASTTTTPIHSEAIFGLLETTCDRFSGKKASKRVRSVKSAVVVETVRVMLLSVLKGLGREDLFDQEMLNTSVESLRAVFAAPATAGVEDIHKSDRFLLERLAKRELKLDGDISTMSDESGMKCVITLDSVMEFVNGLTDVPKTEEELMKWMDTVMQLCMVRFINVKFPLDAFGKTDFNDAWSSRINDISLSSTLTASAAMHLRRESDSDTYLDPLSRKEYTSALILAHPNDPVLTFAFQTLTCLPSLHGLIQGYLVSGGLKVFPSLAPGLHSSALLFHLNNPDIEFSPVTRRVTIVPVLWEVMRTMIWSLRNNMTPSAHSVIKSLKDGKGLNPADAIPKLLAAVILRMEQRGADMTSGEKGRLLKLLFEEVAAGAVAAFHDANDRAVRDGGVATYTRHVDPLVVADCFVESAGGFKGPIEQLHPVEVFVKAGGSVSPTAHEKLAEVLKTSKLCIDTVKLIKKMEAVLQADVKVADPDVAFVGAIRTLVGDGEMAQIMLESVLVGRRTGRYTLDDSVAPPVWVRNSDALDLEALGRGLVGDAYKAQMKGWNQARLEWGHAELVKAFIALVQSTGAEDTVDQVSTKLAQTVVSLHGKQYKLSRMDALELLSHVPTGLLLNVGVAVVMGAWTSEPSCNLRRVWGSLESLFADAGEEVVARLKESVLKQAVATRELANRHGHSFSFQYPGIYGWTEEYHTTRLATHKKPKRMANILQRMKEFTELRKEMMEQAGEVGKEKEMALLFSGFCDMNQVDVAKEESKKLLAI